MARNLQSALMIGVAAASLCAASVPASAQGALYGDPSVSVDLSVIGGPSAGPVMPGAIATTPGALGPDGVRMPPTSPPSSRFYGLPGGTPVAVTPSGPAPSYAAPAVPPRREAYISKPSAPQRRAEAVRPSPAETGPARLPDPTPAPPRPQIATAPDPAPAPKPAPAPVTAPAPEPEPDPRLASATPPVKPAPRPQPEPEPRLATAPPPPPPAPTPAPAPRVAEAPATPPPPQLPAPRAVAEPEVTPPPPPAVTAQAEGTGRGTRGSDQVASLPPQDQIAISDGAMAIVFAPQSKSLSPAAEDGLRRLSVAANRDSSTRLQIQAYAGGAGISASQARRLSLSRALAVRSFLIDQGVRSTRIDVRALGNKVPEGEPNRVDIVTVEQ